MPYRTITADPPWPYHSSDLGSTRAHRPNTPEATRRVAARNRYNLMSVADIAELPVGKMADEAAHLYLWTTNSFIVEAHEVARAWGFEPKTIITWVKHKRGEPTVPSMKMGYWYRSASEHCLFAVRGKLRLKDKVCLPTWFAAPREHHSAKPEGFRTMVEKASPGPYLELFARKASLGWDVWGDQAPGAVEMPCGIVGVGDGQ